jgi:acyl carrier protein
MLLTSETIIEYLATNQGIDAAQIESNETPLFSSGLLDSFSLLELVQFIEETSNVRLGPTDITLDNLDTISGILAFTKAT